jgi:hypothetical protein
MEPNRILMTTEADTCRTLILPKLHLAAKCTSSGVLRPVAALQSWCLLLFPLEFQGLAVRGVYGGFPHKKISIFPYL